MARRLLSLGALVTAVAWAGGAATATSMTMVDLGTPGGADGYATAINSKGQIAGYGNNTAGAEHAFL